MRREQRRHRGLAHGNVFSLVMALLFSSASCGPGGRVETQERWYPTYSEYRVTREEVIVFIHGYGGSEESFAFVPFLAAAAPGRTIMYFNYNTSALKGGLESFSVIGSQLRAFLHNNIFSRKSFTKQPRMIDVVCHSTGCPAVRQYIVDNPDDHGIRKIIMVAGANYGAYFAETAGGIKDWAIVPLLHGDKQIHELRYGSPTLFTLQLRWHCTYLIAERKLAPAQLQMGVCRDYTDRPSALPKIAVVAGTDRRGSFSDGVVRVESATLDCRLVAGAFPGWTGLPQLPGRCADRLIVFLPCFHTSMFAVPTCRRVVQDLVEAFLMDRHSDPVDHEKAVAKLRASYTEAIAGTGVARSVARIQSGAAWIRLRDDDAPRQSIADPTLWASRLDGVLPTFVAATTETDDTWVLGASAVEAVRSVSNAAERIFYRRNLSAPGSTKLEIRVNDQPASIFRTAPRAEATPGFDVEIRPGQTSLIHCDWKRTGAKPGFYCEDLTSGE